MNRKLFTYSAFALAAALAGTAQAQGGASGGAGAGKVVVHDIHFAVPPSPAASLKLYTSAQYPYKVEASGVRVAVGDVNGDGRADLVGLAGTGTAAHVKVFDGKTGSELTGVTAASVGAGVGDANGDGTVDIIINRGGPAGIIINKSNAQSAAGHVKVFDGSTGAEIRVASASAAPAAKTR